jgi:hypothetical protein
VAEPLAQEEDVSVIPNSGALSVGALVAEKVFQRHGNPSDLTMTQGQMAQLCALAAQTAMNAISGKWQ